MFCRNTYMLFTSLILLSLSHSLTHASLGINIAINETRKPMPQGTSSFLELISKGVFVDKTPLIDLFLASKQQVIAITCPKKWAKSTNVDMLKTFLEIPVYQNGTRILPISNTWNYRLFTEGKYQLDHLNVTLEKPLLISDQKYASIRDQFLCQYPVIQLSFCNNNVTCGLNHSRQISQSIAAAFDQHKYMIEVYDSGIQSSKNESEKGQIECKKKEFQLFLEDKVYVEGDYLDNLDRSIYFLSEELHNHFGTKVFIVIDGFDKFLKTYVSDTVQFVLSHAFKDNVHLEKGIVTGVLPVGWEADVVFEEFLNSKYHSYFGFMKNEINSLANFYRIPSQEQKKLEYCYDGYETDRSEKMYNPWSSCNYINSGQLRPYWIEMDNRDKYLNKIFELPEFQFILSKLIIGAHHESSFLYTSFMDMNFKSLNTENALRYLTAIGYLIVEMKPRPNETEEIHSKIPNFEISSHIQHMFALKLSKLYDEELLKLITTTSTLWEQFLNSNDTTSKQLEISMGKCFDSLSTYSANYIYPFDDTNALIHYLVTSIISSKRFDFVGSQFENTATPEVKLRPDIVLSSRPKGRGFFIDLKHFEEGEEDFNITQTRHYGGVLKKYTLLHDWKEIKYINCTLFGNKMVEIRSTLHPTLLFMKTKKKSLQAYLNQMGIE